LTIDALSAGFWVKEVPAELHHRATGNDLRGRLHRAAQLRDVLRALARKRHLSPEIEETEEDAPAERPAPVASPEPAPTPAPLPTGGDDHDEAKVWRVAPEGEEETAARAERRRTTLADLPVDGEFSDDETRALGDV